MADPLTLGLLAASFIGGSSSSKKAAKANRRANELENERRGIQNVLSRRKALAERRRLQASVRAEALASGVGISSAANAATASIDSQVSANVATQRQLEGIDVARNSQIARANKFGQQAANFDRGASLINSVSNAFDDTTAKE